MKKILIVLVLALPIAWWFKDPEGVRSSASKVLQWVQSRSADLAERLESKGNQSGAYGNGVPKKTDLPEGVFVLRESVTAKFLPVAGVINKGTQVRIIGEGEGKQLVTDGTRQALVEARLLTRDPSEVPVLMQAALEALAANRAKRRAELESNLSQIDSKIASVTRELASVRQRDAMAREEGKKNAQYGTQEDFLLGEIRRQEGFREAVLKQLESLPQ